MITALNEILRCLWRLCTTLLVRVITLETQGNGLRENVFYLILMSSRKSNYIKAEVFIRQISHQMEAPNQGKTAWDIKNPR